MRLWRNTAQLLMCTHRQRPLKKAPSISIHTHARVGKKKCTARGRNETATTRKVDYALRSFSHSPRLILNPTSIHSAAEFNSAAQWAIIIIYGCPRTAAGIYYRALECRVRVFACTFQGEDALHAKLAAVSVSIKMRIRFLDATPDNLFHAICIIQSVEPEREIKMLHTKEFIAWKFLRLTRWRGCEWERRKQLAIIIFRQWAPVSGIANWIFANGFTSWRVNWIPCDRCANDFLFRKWHWRPPRRTRSAFWNTWHDITLGSCFAAAVVKTLCNQWGIAKIDMPPAIVAMDNWIPANFAVDEQQESDAITHCLNDWAHFWIYLQRILLFIHISVFQQSLFIILFSTFDTDDIITLIVYSIICNRSRSICYHS